MSAAERERFLIEVNAAHADPASEGRPHKKAKSRALDELSLHFAKTKRTIYLADEMTVIYPGEETFVPDLLAVLDVEQPEEDERMAWVVADEGKGLDLVLEVLHRGSREKDLTQNVARYAHLGIREYFVYDRLHQKIYGHRLPSPTVRTYRLIKALLGRHTSEVLGLDLAIVDRRLRFFSGFAELVGSSELIAQLSEMMTNTEARADQVEAQLAQAEERAAAAQADKAAAQADKSHAEALLLTTLRRSIAQILQVRGFPLSPEHTQRLIDCAEAAPLMNWLEQASTCAGPDELFTATN